MQDPPTGACLCASPSTYKDKITHPGSHAVYNSIALARLQGIDVNHWASDIARDEMLEPVVITSGFR